MRNILYVKFLGDNEVKIALILVVKSIMFYRRIFGNYIPNPVNILIKSRRVT
jgi:hypothetical protein